MIGERNRNFHNVFFITYVGTYLLAAVFTLINVQFPRLAFLHILWHIAFLHRRYRHRNRKGFDIISFYMELVSRFTDLKAEEVR